MDILEKIVADKKLEVEHRKAALPLAQLKERIDRTGIGRTPSLKASLQQGGYGIISEFKRRSPSRGWINEGARASAVPLSYQKSWAAAISILTDGKYFGGSDSFVHEARQSGVILPVLYKNFIIDEYQLYEAKMCGSSAVLLIAACLSEELCGRYIELAHRLGMEVLLEVHSERDALSETQPRHVWSKQPQPRHVRDGCGKLLPPGGEASAAHVPDKRERNLRPQYHGTPRNCRLHGLPDRRDVHEDRRPGTLAAPLY